MKIWSRYPISIAFLSILLLHTAINFRIATALAEDSSLPSYYNRSAIISTRQLYKYEVWLGDKEVCKNENDENTKALMLIITALLIASIFLYLVVSLRTSNRETEEKMLSATLVEDDDSVDIMVDYKGP